MTDPVPGPNELYLPIVKKGRPTPEFTATPTSTPTHTPTPTFTPTPTPTPRVIITEVKALGRLETTKYLLETVIDLEREPANIEHRERLAARGASRDEGERPSGHHAHVGCERPTHPPCRNGETRGPTRAAGSVDRAVAAG